MLSSLLKIRCLSAMLEPVVGAGAGAGLANSFWFRGGTVSNRLIGIRPDVVTPFGADVVLGVGVGVGVGVCAGFVLCLGCGFDLSCLPGCGNWNSSGFLGPAGCGKSACIETSRPTPSLSAFLSSLWPHSVVDTTLVIMSMMPLPHSTSSWWYASRFSSCSSNHVSIPRHCASCSAVCVSSMFAILAMVRCSCASSRACCCAVRSMQLLQSPRPTADGRASLLLLRSPFLFLSVGSSVAVLAVSAAVGVTAVPISIAVGASRVPSPAPSVSMSSHAHSRQSLSRVTLVVACSLVVASHPVFAKPFRESTQLRGSLCTLTCSPSSGGPEVLGV